ncbi:hypothetical protein Rs2_40326 [Raphanus sativus]|nr:hypothetical protein Rs2_40326 [Raphanus sativus]
MRKGQSAPLFCCFYRLRDEEALIAHSSPASVSGIASPIRWLTGVSSLGPCRSLCGGGRWLSSPWKCSHCKVSNWGWWPGLKAISSFNRWTFSEAPACVLKKPIPNTSDFCCRNSVATSAPSQSRWLRYGGETADDPTGVFQSTEEMTLQSPPRIFLGVGVNTWSGGRWVGSIFIRPGNCRGLWVVFSLLGPESCGPGL